MAGSLSQWGGPALLSRGVRNAPAHAGQMTGVCQGRLLEGELGELTTGGHACLGEDVAQVERDGAWGDPTLGCDVLVREARADQLGDLELHRSELDQRGRVALAGCLARRAELLVRPFGERLR